MWTDVGTKGVATERENEWMALCGACWRDYKEPRELWCKCDHSIAWWKRHAEMRRRHRKRMGEIPPEWGSASEAQTPEPPQPPGAQWSLPAPPGMEPPPPPQPPGTPWAQPAPRMQPLEPPKVPGISTAAATPGPLDVGHVGSITPPQRLSTAASSVAQRIGTPTSCSVSSSPQQVDNDQIGLLREVLHNQSRLLQEMDNVKTMLLVLLQDRVTSLHRVRGGR